MRTDRGDYRLSSASACRDSGDPQYVVSQCQGDIEAEPRTNGPIDIGSDEYWAGPVLSLIHPGYAGWTNRIQVRGAPSGALAFFYAALEAGTTNLGFAACPHLQVGLGQAQSLAARPVRANGTATLEATVQPAPSQTTILVQAIVYDTSASLPATTTTNVVWCSFP